MDLPRHAGPVLEENRGIEVRGGEATARPMNQPKNQHIVSQFLLENFTDHKGHLHCFDKTTDTIYRTSPGKALREKHIYSMSPSRGDERYDVEKQFATLEGDVESLLSVILNDARNGCTPSIKEEDLDRIRDFIRIQHLRARPFLRLLSDRKKEVINDIANGKDHVLRIDYVDGTGLVPVRESMPDLEDRFQDALVQSLLFSEYIDLSGKGLVVGLVENSRKSFVIGDWPVIHRIPKGSDFHDPRLQIFMPVAKDATIFLIGERGHRNKIWVDNWTVDRMNLRIAQQSDVIASPSRALVESISKRLLKGI